MANKINTLGYFVNRLRSSGYRVEKIFNNFGKMDPRVWTIVIDPNGASIFCTCYVNHPDRGETTVELYDGGQFIPGKVKLVTNSVEVVMEKLNSFDIINKTARYNNNEYTKDYNKQSSK
jgi:hypothetical protein